MNRLIVWLLLGMVLIPVPGFAYGNGDDSSENFSSQMKKMRDIRLKKEKESGQQMNPVEMLKKIKENRYKKESDKSILDMMSYQLPPYLLNEMPVDKSRMEDALIIYSETIENIEAGTLKGPWPHLKPAIEITLQINAPFLMADQMKRNLILLHDFGHKDIVKTYAKTWYDNLQKRPFDRFTIAAYRIFTKALFELEMEAMSRSVIQEGIEKVYQLTDPELRIYGFESYARTLAKNNELRRSAALYKVYFKEMEAYPNVKLKDKIEMYLEGGEDVYDLGYREDGLALFGKAKALLDTMPDVFIKKELTNDLEFRLKAYRKRRENLDVINKSGKRYLTL